MTTPAGLPSGPSGRPPTKSHRRPPAVPRALLRRLLPSGVKGESILADLTREYRELARRRGRSPRLWYWKEAAALAAHYTLHRIRSVRPPEPASSMDRMRQNIRFALRRLVRNPGFTCVAVLTMALGIGANVATYSVVDAVLLDPLPYEDPGELVALWEWNVPRDRRENVMNPGNFRDWRERSTTIGDMAALTLSQPLVLSGTGDPREVLTVLATPNLFELLGVEAALGRTFSPDAGSREGSESVLTHGFWMETFGGDPDVVGRTLTIQGRSSVVVGVLPPVYIPFGQGAAMFASYTLAGDQTSTGRFLYGVGRLAEGVEVEPAQEELRAIAAALEEEYPDFNGGWSVRVVPLREQVTGEVSGTLWVLLGSVGLLLLVACANVANLFLARATERRREMAVRTSLGASGRILAGQLLVESLVVAALGAAVGVAVAWLGVGLAAPRLAATFSLPRIEGVGMDGGVLLFATAVTVATGVLFGLIPALQASSVAPAETLAAEGRGPGRSSGRVRNALVVAEVAVSVVLVVGAALLGRSLVALHAVDPGIHGTDRVLTARTSLSGPDYEEDESRVRFFTELVERVGALPGVESVGGITFLPMRGLGAASSFIPEEQADRPRPEWPAADVRNVVGSYFESMGIGRVAGRTFDGRDRAGSLPVAVVNRTMAETWWPGESAVGRSLRLSWGDVHSMEIVGVVEDVRLNGPAVEPRGILYLPYAQKPFFQSMNLTVRTSVAPTSLTEDVRAQVTALDPGLPLSGVRVMGDVLDDAVARPRLTALLMGTFAALAGLLAVVGVYGVLACSVAARVREIGVRIAMGARGSTVVGLVLRQGMAWVVLGLVIGVVTALAAARLLEGLLFGVTPTDPASLAGAAGLVLVAAAFACLVPAWRAARVEPSEALRQE